MKTVSGLIGVANHYYDIAGKSVRFRTRHRAYFFMARNFQLMENTRSAIEHVSKARQALETARMVPKQKAEDKVKLLALLLKLQTERGDDQAAQQTQQILAAARAEAETAQNITLADVEKAMAARPKG